MISLSKLEYFQGESLSPCLFNLFLSDVFQWFHETGLNGVNIDHGYDVMGLLFADDFILFGDSRTDAQAKLNVFGKYCRANGLKINCRKTKVVIFRASPRCRKRPSLLLDNEPIEYVNSVTYLGVPFSCTGKFRQAADFFVNRGTKALGKVREILVKGKVRSWETSLKLFNSIAAATALHASEVWALGHLDRVEGLYIRFFKNLFNLHRTTPNHFVRIESGVSPLRMAILKRTLKWWITLMSMERDDLPRRCYERILDRTCFHPENLHDSWFAPLGRVLGIVGYEDVFRCASYTWIMKNKNDILERWRNHLISVDIERVMASRYNPRYRHLSSLGAGEEYIGLEIPIQWKRIFMQLRLSAEGELRLYLRGITYKIDTSGDCPVCNLRRAETLQHIFLECPMYASVRDGRVRCQGDYVPTLYNIFAASDKDQIFRTVQFLTEALKIRSFIMFE